MLRKALNKKKKGFTLIELIIVIAIIAILSAVALPKFMEIRENSNQSSDIANGKTIATAVSTLVAEDKIIVAAVGDKDIAVSSAAAATGDVKALQGRLQSIPKIKTASYTAYTYIATVRHNGDVIVYATNGTNKLELYPNATTVFTN